MSLQISIANVIGGGQVLNTPPPPNNSFISEWKTTSINEVVTLPYQSNGVYSGTIDWGDGSTSDNTFANRSHTYEDAGTYNISIDGVVRIFRFNNTGDKDKIYRIFQWGNQFDLGTTSSQFYGCSNLDLSEVIDVLKVSTRLRNFANIFRDCTSLTVINNIENWNVSNITSFQSSFQGCVNFNQSLNGWDTGRATNMAAMFFGCTSFNGDIGAWNTGRVIFFNSFLQDCTNFNQDISLFKLDNCTNTSQMFYGATSFNVYIGDWNVSNVTNMTNMFRNATDFNQNIGTWDVSNVVNFSNFMFGKTFSNFSTENYDTILIGWASRPVNPNLLINFGTIKRTAASTAAKLVLTSAPNNWTIVDGGI